MGEDDSHNEYADQFPPNRYPGMDVLVGGVSFDALQAGVRVLWEIKTHRFDSGFQLNVPISYISPCSHIEGGAIIIERNRAKELPRKRRAGWIVWFDRNIQLKSAITYTPRAGLELVHDVVERNCRSSPGKDCLQRLPSAAGTCSGAEGHARVEGLAQYLLSQAGDTPSTQRFRARKERAMSTPPFSPTCSPIAKALDALRAEKNELSNELKSAAPGQKSSIATQIKHLETQIQAKQAELNQCVLKHPYTPAPANPCLALLEEVNKLKAALRQEIQKVVAPLQEELKQAHSPSEKQALVAQIKEQTESIKKNSPLTPKISAKQKQYEECLKAHGGKLALDATFTGKATLQTSNSNAHGPFTQSITLGLHFSDWDRREVAITSFPPISVAYDTHSPAGVVTTTVSLLSGSGTFNAATHTLMFNLKLHFHHSTSLAGDSDLDVLLTTTSPLDAQGHVTVDGSGQFQGGYLDGDTCWVMISGTISPSP